MDVVPILSTIILIATAVTLIVAISSYFIFRIKEKRREARAAAALRRRQKEDREKTRPSGANPIVEEEVETNEDERLRTDRRSTIAVVKDDGPAVIHNRRSEDRRRSQPGHSHPRHDPDLNRRVADRRNPPQVDSSGFPISEFSRRKGGRREEVERETSPYQPVAYQQPAPQAHQRQEAQPAPARSQNLTNAQAAFMESLKVPEPNAAAPNAPVQPDDPQNEEIRLRKFSIGKPDQGTSKFPGLKDDGNEWK